MIQTLSTHRPRPVPQRKVRPSLETFIGEKFRSSPYRDLHSVRYHCHGGTVLLTGVLPSFFLKQMAQESIRHVAGVLEIDNRVEVIYAEGLVPCAP